MSEIGGTEGGRQVRLTGGQRSREEARQECGTKCGASPGRGVRRRGCCVDQMGGNEGRGVRVEIEGEGEGRELQVSLR